MRLDDWKTNQLILGKLINLIVAWFGFMPVRLGDDKMIAKLFILIFLCSRSPKNRLQCPGKAGESAHDFRY